MFILLCELYSMSILLHDDDMDEKQFDTKA